MQSPSPRVPEQSAPNRPDSAPVRADVEARLTPELASVVSGARRRAHRDGDHQIDTAHLLHSLLETDPEVRAAFDGPQLARVLGYLVQRSIGYGLRWQGTVEDSGAVPVVREREVTGWSPPAVTAMASALERAERRGEPLAGGLDLLAALAADRECRAVDVLERAGVDARSLAGRLSSTSRSV
ncbi:Clp protease N-terminal domain-containing protein [Streptomyces sp. 35G-GA-8]|uniref:Clp protease N-terminal domain-containing protein n=1 Tax=Streptomyces sp. 35G-GA-8 TaxID=2939434 RepID=UPI00201EC45C|nr:Clp protease N-terminal domain-containing protein [Streptomyces sp. 35G-GA-8]MCL7376536.1 peptidase [Streptomyces sp. 35G-GA-8]